MIGMRRLIRRTLGAGALALLLAAGVATATAPEGPRLAVVKETRNPNRITLLTVDPHGKAPMRLAGGQKRYSPLAGFGRLAWRPDGAEVAVPGIDSIFLAKADGSGASELNIAGAERPVFAPDGHTLSFTRTGLGEAVAWTIDLASGAQRQLTPSRRGLKYFSSSFSPDGTTLLATRIDAHRDGQTELMALHLDTGGATRVLADGFAPYYSPDGLKIAFLREVGDPRATDLFVLNVATGSLRQLTHTPHKDELFASWDPSGERIAFARFPRRHYEWANSIVEINADGTCETEVLAQKKRTVFYGSAWQPGPGHVAGRISC
jgi:dipeptidyl aminopeptidase/acylaminoacyl peptidase